MADLRELEEDLKRMIDERNKPLYGQHKPRLSPNNDNNITLMVIKEHGQPYNTGKMITRMAIQEHGQPYSKEYENFIRTQTYMAVPEHGQPYSKEYEEFYNKGYEDFILRKQTNTEHGQPYRSSKRNTRDNSSELKDFMTVTEHGQP